MRGKRANNEKPKNFKEAMKNLFFFLKPYLVMIIIAVVLASVLPLFPKNKGSISSLGYQESVSESHEMPGEIVQLGDLCPVGL